MTQSKRVILEAVATAEKELRPFENSLRGVSYEDIDDDLNMSDLGIKLNTTAYIPPRLSELADESPPKLYEAMDSGAEASANYRLTDHGWDIVDQEQS